jgi:hypothetical protein
MKLYIANCTKKNYELHYRMPEVMGVRMQPVRAGHQVEIAGDLNQPQIDVVVKHFSTRYGMVSVTSIDRTKAFVGLCYSTDKPIKVDVIARALHHNDQVLVSRGQDIRRAAAVSVNNAITQQLQESRVPESLGALEMTVDEVDRGGKPVDGGLREGVLVDPNAPPEMKITTKKPRSSRQRADA